MGKVVFLLWCSSRGLESADSGPWKSTLIFIINGSNITNVHNIEVAKLGTFFRNCTIQFPQTTDLAVVLQSRTSIHITIDSCEREYTTIPPQTTSQLQCSILIAQSNNLMEIYCLGLGNKICPSNWALMTLWQLNLHFLPWFFFYYNRITHVVFHCTLPKQAYLFLKNWGLTEVLWLFKALVWISIWSCF